MKRLELIFICTLILLFRIELKAQPRETGVVFYASMNEVKPTAAQSSISLNEPEENAIATIPFGGTYYDNYYGLETFEVYAGEAVNLSLVYLKVTTPLNSPITVVVVNCQNEELIRYTAVKHPLIIGYGLKPGLYFIHVVQGKKEMVLRFSKGV